MATEAVNPPVNGTYPHHSYGTGEQTFGHQATSSTSTTGYATGATQQGEISKEEVAWYFAESYYTTMSRTPDKLHHYFNKRSQFVYGVEGEKSSVALGIKTIKDRLADLDYQDCKVRITNIDSQAADQNIVIQVIGEMSNKSQPHRKFVQTFVLAGQTNGYFVLNDIFRFIKEDEEEPEAETQGQSSHTVVDGVKEPAPAVEEDHGAAATETVEHEEEVAQVDKKLEEIKQVEESEDEEETSPAAVNGAPLHDEAEVVHAEETPAAAVSASEAKADEVVDADKQPEKPRDPLPSPAAQTPAAPPKPAVPRTWAQLAGSTRTGPAPAAANSTPTAQPKPAAPSPAPAAAVSSTPAATSATNAPAREPSPVDSNKEGSSGGWQTAGADHVRKQSRAQNAPVANQDGRIRAYVKNVSASLDAETLKTHLSKFGELVYFDIARAKNAAFVEYKNVAGFQAAVNANPHRLGGEDIWVEERRVTGPFNQRGNSRGGRGSFDGRPSQGGRGDFKGAPRGNFAGRGRGGSGNVTPRGRGAAQAA